MSDLRWELIMEATVNNGLKVEFTVILAVGVPIWLRVGLKVGVEVGATVGLKVGADVGADEGLAVGFSVGAIVGLADGAAVRLPMGAAVGLRVGFEVGADVRAEVGIEFAAHNCRYTYLAFYFTNYEYWFSQIWAFRMNLFQKVLIEKLYKRALLQMPILNRQHES